MRAQHACRWVAALALVACSSNPRGICPDPARGTGTWSGWHRAGEPSPPTTDGSRVFRWSCSTSECGLTAFDTAGYVTGAPALSDGTMRRFGVAAAGQGYVLVVGGLTELTAFGEPLEYATSALLYDMAEDSWTEIQHPAGFLTGMDHEVVWTGTAFLTWGGWRMPGEVGTQPHGELEAGAMFDPDTRTWRSITDTGRPDGQGPMIWTSHGLFLWVYSPDQTQPSAWLYSPDDDAWEALPLQPGLTPRYAALAASDEAVYVVGGDNYTYGEGYRYVSTPSWLREVWEFRLEERTWSKVAIPGDAAVGYLTQFVDDRLYLIDNHCAPGSFYAPATGEWGVTSWPDGFEAPAYALQVEGKLSLFGTVDHLAGTASFFQYTP